MGTSGRHFSVRGSGLCPCRLASGLGPSGLSDGHIDKPHAQIGEFGGGLFAIFVPGPGDKALWHDDVASPSYEIALSDQIYEAVATDWTERGFDAMDDLAAA
jgi:membrane dipeptidase